MLIGRRTSSVVTFIEGDIETVEGLDQFLQLEDNGRRQRIRLGVLPLVLHRWVGVEDADRSRTERYARRLIMVSSYVVGRMTL